MKNAGFEKTEYKNSVKPTEVSAPANTSERADDFWKAMTFISVQNQFFVARIKHIL